MKSLRGPFLTAQWRHLLMANFEVERDALTPLIPSGTELDLWRGRALISVVGFRFLDTRLRGIRVPFHADFDEVNLRFYLRRRVDGVWRRGVAFVKEFVPRAALAWVARRVYEEPYVAVPMRHRVEMQGTEAGRPGTVRYEWKQSGRWHVLEGTTFGSPEPLRPGSEEEFIAEHYWGWTARSDGSTAEYEVKHPPWRVWQVGNLSLDCDVRRLYGAALGEALSRPACSTFLAEGSLVEVFPGRALSDSP